MTSSLQIGKSINLSLIMDVSSIWVSGYYLDLCGDVVYQTGLMLCNFGLSCCNDISCEVNQFSYIYPILCTVSQSEFYQYLSRL